MCANTTIGVLRFPVFDVVFQPLELVGPSEPPPGFRFITLTRPMKCTPFLSKLYHPAPLALSVTLEVLLAVVVQDVVLAGNVEHILRDRALKTWSTVSNSSGFERWLMSPVWSMNSGCDREDALILSTAAFSVPTTSGSRPC